MDTRKLIDRVETERVRRADEERQIDAPTMHGGGDDAPPSNDPPNNGGGSSGRRPPSTKIMTGLPEDSEFEVVFAVLQAQLVKNFNEAFKAAAARRAQREDRRASAPFRAIENFGKWVGLLPQDPDQRAEIEQQVREEMRESPWGFEPR